MAACFPAGNRNGQGFHRRADDRRPDRHLRLGAADPPGPGGSIWRWFDNRRPAASDDIAHTLNYKAVSKRLEQFVRESEFGLVETLAERCAQIVLDEFDVKWLRLKLSKPGAVRGARAVGVIIERSRD